MKILAAIILCGLFGIGGTTESHVESSMESKLSGGHPLAWVALHLLNYNAQQIPYLAVQLMNRKHNALGTGVFVSKFVILIAGSAILEYEEKPGCGGVKVSFRGVLYSVSKCESRFEIAENPNDDTGNRLYNDIATVAVNLGQLEPRIRLLENPDLMIDGVPFGIGTTAYLLGYNEVGNLHMLRTVIINIGVDCFHGPRATTGANKVFCARLLRRGQVFRIDQGSPLFVRGALVGVLTGELQKHARSDEAIFSSYFEHFHWITEKITHYNNDPPPSSSDECI